MKEEFFNEDNIEWLNYIFGLEIPVVKPGEKNYNLMLCVYQYLFDLYESIEDMEESLGETFENINKWDTYGYIYPYHIIFNEVNYDKNKIVIGDFSEEEEEVIKRIHDSQFNVKSNLDMLTEFLSNYEPGKLDEKEISRIERGLRLRLMDRIQLENMHDTVALYFKTQNSDDMGEVEKWISCMTNIETVIRRML